MTVNAARGDAKGTAKMSGIGDTRYSFTAQFLCSSAIFSRRCKEIEQENPDNPDETIRTEHRGLVTAVIMQCAAAVEAESAEITLHGPGGHLGLDGIDAEAHKFLAPLAGFIDRQKVLDRYNLILHLLDRPPFKGETPWQNMAILISVRNELIHYKSKWGEEMSRKNLFERLEQLPLSRPSWISLNQNFFPHQFLSADCAAWSVRTAVDFLNTFYKRLDIESPLKPHTAQFKGL